MKNKVSQINKSIQKWEIDKKCRSLTEAIEESTIGFKDTNQGMEILAFAAAMRALGLSNRDLQPRKLSNYIRSGYLQSKLYVQSYCFNLEGMMVSAEMTSMILFVMFSRQRPSQISGKSYQQVLRARSSFEKKTQATPEEHSIKCQKT